MPPTFPPITGVPFHIASATVSPKPSRKDFCNTTAARVCNAFTNAVSSPLVRIRMCSPWQAQSDSKISRPSGSSVAKLPSKTSLASSLLLNWRFLMLNGLIAGMKTRCGGFISCWYSGQLTMAASYRSIQWRKYFHISASGRERSIWQRQIHGHLLRDREKVSRSLNYAPFGTKTKAVHEQGKRGNCLRDAASVVCRIEIGHAEILELPGLFADARDVLDSNKRLVVFNLRDAIKRHLLSDSFAVADTLADHASGD